MRGWSGKGKLWSVDRTAEETGILNVDRSKDSRKLKGWSIEEKRGSRVNEKKEEGGWKRNWLS